MSACVLYHFAFDPGSRAARLALGEARIDFSETPVRPWENGCPVATLNPSGMPPVLQVAEADGQALTLCEPAAILGWLEERTTESFLLPADAAERAEVRRLLARRDALAGRRISQADIVAAAHLSVLDYFGEVSWANWPAVKTWYMKLKSRPCFRPLLADRFPGVPPSTWYADLDF